MKAPSSLATKYRPQTFKSLVGQEVAVKKVQGALAKEQIPRTWLITGPYGSGKSTSMRVIARSLNCQKHGPSSSCLDHKESRKAQCASCIAFGEDNHSDYQEVNAADTNGIDYIRSLIAMSQQAPRYRYRVFALDESHSLSAQAFKALLKPLEEPSSRMVWILGTSEKSKIPPEIRSRCFDVQLVSVPVNVTASLLVKIAHHEGMELDEESATLISQSASGNPRLAITTLEGVLSYTASSPEGESIKDAIPGIISQAAKSNPYFSAIEYCKAIASSQIKEALKIVSSVDSHEFFIKTVVETWVSSAVLKAGGPPTQKGQTVSMGSLTLQQIVSIQYKLLAAQERIKSYALDNTIVLQALTLDVLV
jgi:DNA polymerase III subunit gamma/tau